MKTLKTLTKTIILSTAFVSYANNEGQQNSKCAGAATKSAVAIYMVGLKSDDSGELKNISTKTILKEVIDDNYLWEVKVNESIYRILVSSPLDLQKTHDCVVSRVIQNIER